MKQFSSVVPFRHELSALIGVVEGKANAYDKLESVLAKRAIQDPVGANPASIGWQGNGEGAMLYRNDAATLLCVSVRERVLPGSVVVNEVKRLAKRLEEIQGFKPGRKQLRELKEQALENLLPKSHIRESIVPIILRQKWLFVCTSSQKRVDQVMSLLIATIGDLGGARDDHYPMRVQTNTTAHAWMTEVILDGVDNEGVFMPGTQVTLTGRDADSGIVSFREEEGTSERIRDMVTSGKYVPSKMQLRTNSLTFTLRTGMILSGIKFSDIVLESTRGDDAVSAFDANLSVTAMEYQQLMRELVGSMGGLLEHDSTPDGDDKYEVDETTTEQPDEYVPRYWYHEMADDQYVSNNKDEEPDPDDVHVIEITQEEYERREEQQRSHETDDDADSDDADADSDPDSDYTEAPRVQSIDDYDDEEL